MYIYYYRQINIARKKKHKRKQASHTERLIKSAHTHTLIVFMCVTGYNNTMCQPKLYIHPAAVETDCVWRPTGNNRQRTNTAATSSPCKMKDSGSVYKSLRAPSGNKVCNEWKQQRKAYNGTALNGCTCNPPKGCALVSSCSTSRSTLLTAWWPPACFLSAGSKDSCR